MANSEDPDEMAHNEPSFPELHCLHRYLVWSTGLKGLNCFCCCCFFVFVFFDLIRTIFIPPAFYLVGCCCNSPHKVIRKCFIKEFIVIRHKLGLHGLSRKTVPKNNLAVGRCRGFWYPRPVGIGEVYVM